MLFTKWSIDFSRNKIKNAVKFDFPAYERTENARTTWNDEKKCPNLRNYIRVHSVLQFALRRRKSSSKIINELHGRVSYNSASDFMTVSNFAVLIFGLGRRRLSASNGGKIVQNEGVVPCQLEWRGRGKWKMNRRRVSRINECSQGIAMVAKWKISVERVRIDRVI